MSRPSVASVSPAAHGRPARILGIDPGLQVTGYAVLESRSGTPHVCEAGIVRSRGGRG